MECYSLAEDLTEELTSKIRQWLHAHIPDWSAFLIKDAAKYHGIFLGPRAGKYQWADVVAKWKSRTIDIACTHASAAISATLYNSRALPVLLYKSQLLPLPRAFHMIEKAGLHHLLHLATNSCDAAMP